MNEICARMVNQATRLDDMLNCMHTCIRCYYACPTAHRHGQGALATSGGWKTEKQLSWTAAGLIFRRSWRICIKVLGLFVYRRTNASKLSPAEGLCFLIL